MTETNHDNPPTCFLDPIAGDVPEMVTGEVHDFDDCDPELCERCESGPSMLSAEALKTGWRIWLTGSVKDAYTGDQLSGSFVRVIGVQVNARFESVDIWHEMPDESQYPNSNLTTVGIFQELVCLRA